MSKTYLKSSIIVTLLLCSVMAFVLLAPTLKRGLFFREDYLPFLSTVAALFALVSVIAVLKGDNLWRGDVDVLIAIIVGLYFLTNVWAQSKMNAMDGALKYAGYLMVFLMARYASASELGSRILRNLLILSGVVVASAGYLTAAEIAKYPTAVQGGALLGSFQYPNALAAFAMFLLFLLYYAWYEEFRNPALSLGTGILYSVSAFLLVGSVFLTNSRATLLMFGAFVVLYGVLLPGGARSQILSRVAISLISFGAVGSRLDLALKKSDAASMKQGLAIGLALSAALEAGRWLWDRRRSGAPNMVSEVAGTVSAIKPAGMSPKAIFLRLAVAGLIVAVASVGLIAAVKNPSTSAVLSKVLPERITAQLKTLSLTDKSMLIRFMATKDALSIALDHPFGTGAGGWQALYHQYQRTPYWFTETHNHFAQMLVEVGFLGLAVYAAFWGILGYAAIKTYLTLLKAQGNVQGSKHQSAADATRPGLLVRVASSAMAVFALGVHSALDFDLSLPAISVALFASVAVLLVDVADALPRIPRLGGIAKRRLPKTPSERKTSRKKAVPTAFPWGVVVTVLATVALVSSVTVTVNRLYKGMVYGSTAMKTFASENLSQARRYMSEAMTRDKWNPAYPLELAKWSLEDYLADEDAKLREMVRLYLELARVADGSDLSRQQAETLMLQKTGLVDDAVRAAYEVVEMVPTNRPFHESLAELGRLAISKHAKAILRADASSLERDEHLDQLSGCAKLLTSACEILATKRERVTGIYATVFNPKGLEFTPKIALTAGEVAFLAGNMETSGALLSTAAKDKSLGQEANTWLSYLSEATDYKATFPAGFESNVEETRRMAALFGAVKETR